MIKKYRNTTTRLKTWDYGSNGSYFVTICTQNREHYFGEIVPVQNITPQQLESSPIGKIAHQYWMEIPNHFPFVLLDEFIIMPDHVHGILTIEKAQYFEKVQYFGEAQYFAPLPNTFGPQSQNLASIIRGYKAGVKKYATMNNITFGWQSGYHDHIIRSERERQAIRRYIQNNPAKWSTAN
jgi:putative transposase